MRKLGVAERKQRARERRLRDGADPVKTLSATSEEDKKLLKAAGDHIEQITAERDQLQAERDKLAAELADNKVILADLSKEAEKFQVERDQAQAELADNQDILAGLADQATEFQAERDQLMEVLKLPGAKQLLAKQYDPDKSGATEAEKRELTGFAQKVNIAYDLIKKEARAKKSDEAA